MHYHDRYLESNTSDTTGSATITSTSQTTTTSTTTSDLASYERVVGGAGSQRLYGSENDDYITSGGGADKIYGGAGDDRIEITGDAGGGAVEVIGGEGDDTIIVSEDFIGVLEIDAGDGLDNIKLNQDVVNIYLSEDGNSGHLVYDLGDGSELRLLNQLEKDPGGSWQLSENAVEWIELNDGSLEFFDPDAAADQGVEAAITIRGSEG